MYYINKKAEGLMAQLIAQIHTSAEHKVQLRVILPLTSISQINSYYNW